MPTEDKIVAATLAAAVIAKSDAVDAKAAVDIYRQVLAELETEPAEMAGGEPQARDTPKVG
jgi:hypothetical protein